MKKSWEIIIAGILLLFVAVFITAKNEDSDSEVYQDETEFRSKVEREQQTQAEAVKVIQLDELAELRELKELESLASLDQLKELAKLVPEQSKNEIKAELEAALRELEGDSFSIDINLNDQVVMLKKEYAKAEGEWARASSGVYAITKEFDASSLKEISVQLTSGSLVLVGTDNKKGSYTITASGDVNSVSDLQNNLSVDLLNKNSKAEFRVNRKSEDASNVQLQTVITVPSSLEILAYTNGGHIDATNFEGVLEFKTSGGHIKLRNTKGNVTAFTEGGHITISDGKGDVSLKSLGGHLQALNTEGNLEMRTSGGNVEVQNFSGSINAFTSGGNIKLDIIKLSGELQARNGAGQIDLLLPAEPGFSVNSNGTKIDIDSEFDFIGDKKKGQLIGKVGDGKIDVIAKTGYGTVTIKKND